MTIKRHAILKDFGDGEPSKVVYTMHDDRPILCVVTYPDGSSDTFTDLDEVAAMFAADNA